MQRCLLVAALLVATLVHAAATRGLTHTLHRPRHRADAVVCPYGSACDPCSHNQFGPNCTECPHCAAVGDGQAGDASLQGRCDDGVTGTGVCKVGPHATGDAFDECADLSAPCPVVFAQGEGGRPSRTGTHRGYATHPGGNLLLTSLITSVPDQQRHYVHTCDINHREWYATVRALGLSALILHDCLTPDQVVLLQTQRIRFLSVPGPANVSVGDFRYPLYYGLLSGQDITGGVDAVRIDAVWRPPVRNVFITDLFDVWFAGNPFELVFGDRYHIYIGNEGEAWNQWMYDRAKTCGYSYPQVYTHPTNVTHTIYNTGIIGGPVEPVLLLLRLMSTRFLTLPDKMANCDMPFLNFILHDVFDDAAVFTGPPLHSRFTGYDRDMPGPYIRHK